MTRTNKIELVALAAFACMLACRGEDAKKDYTVQHSAPDEMADLSKEEGSYGRGESGGGAKADQKMRRASPAKPAASAPDPGSATLGYAMDGEMDEKPADDAAPTAPSERGAATRSWFPETFLFAPMVATNASGSAEVTVTVPDRLTTWRVLALAHSRSGAQAGTVAKFLGTLPTYVDPILPAFLRAGDSVKVPIQLVNTTREPIRTTLALDVVGAELNGGEGAVTLPAQGSVVRYATLRSKRPGTIRFHARLGTSDAVVRSIDVLPTGKPVTQNESATLAAPRTFALVGPAAADPSLDRVRLQVFPGALAILRSELAASVERGGVAEDAFALLLAGKAPDFLRALGDEPDGGALRKLGIIVTQRIVRHARLLDITTATLFAEAALAHPDNSILTNIGRRSLGYIEDNQLPDGTCGGETGWTLQRLLVATADCARAAHSVPAVTIRAGGAFERHAEQIEDAYTAAAILASGAVKGKLAETLRDKVKAAIEERKNGAKVLVVPEGVVRADGLRPSEVDATALAVLALAGDKPLLADLGATVLAGYSPTWGWGDGRTNLVAMQAVLDLFKDPIPDAVKISLTMDGKVVAEGELNRDRIREILALEANDINAAGSHEWKVSAEPAVAGLGFSLALTSWVPWPAPATDVGLELAVSPPLKAEVGQPADIVIRAVAPAGRPLHIKQSLPAGVQVDNTRLDALVSDGTLTRYDFSDGMIELFTPALEPAQVFTARFTVIATLAGTLQTGASTVTFDNTTVTMPPSRWTIK